MNRVVITGVGMVSSLGVGKDEIWPKIKEGISGIDFLKRVDNTDLKTKFGGEIAEHFNAEDFIDAKKQEEAMYLFNMLLLLLFCIKRFRLRNNP